MIYYYICFLCTVLVLANSERLFTSELCHAELERARHVVHSTANVLARQEHRRRRAVLAELHATVPLGNYRSRRFAIANGDDPGALCPQPNTTMFPPVTTSPVSREEEDDRSWIKKKSSASRHISVPSLFRLEDPESDPYVIWMKTLHGHLNRDDAVCNGPKFRGLQTVTEGQMWGFASLLLANYGSPLCPICDAMMGRFEGIIYQPNRLLYNEEEQFMHRMLFGALPTTQTICSAVLPSCHKHYEIKVANVTAGTECMKCTLCRASLIALQHRFLLDAEMVKKALEWLDSSFIHNICAEMCLAFPPGNSSVGNFFPHGVNYTECVDFSNKAFAIAVNAAKNILKPEFFCSVEMGWCEQNATPTILHCLRKLCEENLPERVGMSVCKLIPDGESIPAPLKTPHIGPKLFPTPPQPSKVAAEAAEKSEL